MDNRKQTGKLAEQLAVDFLSRQQWVIVEQNWRCRSGELDIIALDGETYVFVEVRARREHSRQGTAAESVNRRKQRQVRSTAQVYLLRKRLDDVPVRFDVIAITLGAHDALGELEHYRDAF